MYPLSVSDVQLLSSWLPATVGVAGVILGSLVTGVFTHLRENRSRAHEITLKEDERRITDTKESEERIRLAYVDLLAAISDDSRGYAEFTSRGVSGVFSSVRTPAALASLQMLVQDGEAAKLEESIDTFRRSYYGKSADARAEVIAIYRSRQ